ncbi:MAG TPA: MgtC/SapB family protein [Chryseolinea sp.]|nr:MgtC/SapB family protein [Chryseolinea sp.]
MDITFQSETALQLLFSFIIGTAIGIEREYRSKAAGLRTMIMICLGSTIFTELSMAIGNNSEDRIASNIITGIGFLGAGVIFKDGLSISGITTATTIWITAALGMAVGAGQYFIAFVSCVAILIVLLFFEVLQKAIARAHQERTYKITTREDLLFSSEFEKEVKSLKLTFRKERDIRNDGDYILVYQVSGGEKKLDEINNYLKCSGKVVSYEY